MGGGVPWPAGEGSRPALHNVTLSSGPEACAKEPEQRNAETRPQGAAHTLGIASADTQSLRETLEHSAMGGSLTHKADPTRVIGGGASPPCHPRLRCCRPEGRTLSCLPCDSQPISLHRVPQNAGGGSGFYLGQWFRTRVGGSCL